MAEEPSSLIWAGAAVFLLTAVSINLLPHLSQQDGGSPDTHPPSNDTRPSHRRTDLGVDLTGLLRDSVPRCKVYHVFEPGSSRWIATAANRASGCSMMCPLHYHCNVSDFAGPFADGNEWPYYAVDDCHFAASLTSLRCGAFSLFRPRFSPDWKQPTYWSAGSSSWTPRTDVVPEVFAGHALLPIDPQLIDVGTLSGLVDTYGRLLELIRDHSGSSRGFLIGVPSAFVGLFNTNSALHPLQTGFKATFARLWQQAYGEPPPRQVDDVLKRLTKEWLAVAKDLFLLYTKGGMSDVNKALVPAAKLSWWKQQASQRHRQIALLFRLFFRSDLTQLDPVLPPWPKRVGTAHRITTASRALIETAYRKGMAVSWPAFASTSLCEDVTREFDGGFEEEETTVGFEVFHGVDFESGEGGFTFNVPWGLVHKNVFFSILLLRCHEPESAYTYVPRLVQGVSTYGEEEEVLLPPLFPLTVVRIGKAPGGKSGYTYDIGLGTNCSAATSSVSKRVEVRQARQRDPCIPQRRAGRRRAAENDRPLRCRPRTQLHRAHDGKRPPVISHNTGV
mmetsp:Transcript_5075/g.13886  ORF Transcript_5075/g.13886 Transcript_5075/m.13886 type:complete len:561 (-) Transcript_5075:1260-2942(-)